MGADFIYAVADTTKPIEHWQTILGEFDDGQMKQYLNNTHLDYLYEVMFEGEDEPWYQAVAEWLGEALVTVYAGSRESGTFRENGKHWTITGGMSWGDEPTDIFPYVNAVGDWQQFVEEELGIK